MTGRTNPYSQYNRNKVYFPDVLYSGIGDYLSRQEQYERSIKFYDKAVRNNPSNPKILTRRARARGKICLHKGALEDIRQAVESDGNNLRSLEERVTHTYLSNEFEQALLQNSRLALISKNPEFYALNEMTCKDVIESTIGAKAGRPLRDYFPVIRKQAWERNISENAKSRKIRSVLKSPSLSEIPTLIDSLYNVEASINIPKISNTNDFQSVKRLSTNLEYHMAENYLGCLRHDKQFLKRIQEHPGLISPNQEGSEKIGSVAKKAIGVVSCKQEDLRARRPFYFLKLQDSIVKESLGPMKQAERQKRNLATQEEAHKLLAKLERAFNAKQLQMVIEDGEKLWRFCRTRQVFLNRETFIKEVIELVKRSYYQVVIKTNIQLEEFLELLPNVFEYKHATVEVENRIKLFKNYMKTSRSKNEFCWCYYELCKMNIELRRLESAKIFAKRCLRFAEEIKESEWCINAYLLATKIYLLQHQLEDAQRNLLDAIEIAQQSQDYTATNNMKYCFNVIDRMTVDDPLGLREVKHRQAQILSIIEDPKDRESCSHLFHHIRTLTKHRRFDVIPRANLDADFAGK